MKKMLSERLKRDGSAKDPTGLTVFIVTIWQQATSWDCDIFNLIISFCMEKLLTQSKILHWLCFLGKLIGHPWKGV